MSQRYVALIRGINVGRAKRVSMADLKALFEGLGYREVRTLLNSGNVVFSAPGSARRTAAAKIEKAFVARVGFAARVFVLGADEIAAALDENPFGKSATDPSRLMVTLIAESADRAALKALAKQSWTPDRVAIGTLAVYQWCPNGMAESKLAEALAKQLGEAGTTRNWATLSKLHALVRD
jgi:uncharacterized protein (DUF1697 family)